jgi:hypothetical protein
MFEDIYKPESEEVPATPFCVHKLMQTQCPDYEDADDPKFKICKYFGKLTSHCYKDVKNV